MNNIFKFMGIALMACSLTLVSCSKDDNDSSSNNNATPSVTSTFNGQTINTFGYQSLKYYASYECYAGMYLETNQSYYPGFDFCSYQITNGSATDVANNGQFSDDATIEYCEYFESTYLQDGSGNVYGDYWAETVTTNVKAIDLTALTLTVTMEGTMFNAAECMVQNATVSYEDATRAPFKFDMVAQSMTAAK